jgi:uncharacterized protein (TIGR00304 family)
VSRFKGLALALLLGGIGLIALSIMTGEGSVYLALFIPVFAGSGPLGIAGIACIAGAFFSYFYGLVEDFRVLGEEAGEGGRAVPREGKRPVEGGHARTGRGMKSGGVVLIGPIPIIFGSDKKSLFYIQVLAVIILVLALVFFVFGGAWL